jgi:hypothetical protein
MRPETKANAIAFIKGMQQRTQEHGAFLVAAQKAGLTPQEAGVIWTNYIKKNPFYSSSKHTLIEKNFNKWPQYLTQEKIQEALSPSSNSSGESENGNTKMFNILDPQGNVVARGSSENTATFLKDHRGYSRVSI